MNLIAHQYLSFGNQEIQLGNFLGEIIKGSKYNRYSHKVKTGILLHRSIDFYTDSHETVKKSSSYFHSTQHKYSPIVVDVVYDYFLIKHWEKYSKEPFSIFKENCYQLFEYESKNLPTQAQKMIFYMLDDDWFSNYSTIEGVQRTLRGIGKQTKFKNNLDNITPEFEANYSQLEQDFLHFFPELFLHCLDFLKIAK